MYSRASRLGCAVSVAGVHETTSPVHLRPALQSDFWPWVPVWLRMILIGVVTRRLDYVSVPKVGT